MIKWCAYCQQFMHEIAPYDDFSITHGLCVTCVATRKDLFASDEIARAHLLREMFTELFDAGRHEDVKTAARIIEKAINANCRPVDILIGMIAPMLYQIGEEWKRGALSVEAEHRFTAFSEQVIDLVKSAIEAGRVAPANPKAALVSLMNAPGNRHILAVRILGLWLESRGAIVRTIDHDASTANLMQSIAAERPKFLLISMALPNQRNPVARIANAIEALPPNVRPRVIVGGYPVKAGLIAKIPAVELLSDISTLQLG